MAKARRTPRLVAVVEDDEGVRTATESLLRSAGYATRTFGSAEQFLRSRLRRQASCLILDVELPGMSGLQLQERLAQRRLHIPVVFITAIEDRGRRFEIEVLQSGAVAYLRKPFDAKELLRAVRSACSGKRRQQKGRRHPF
jgi:FixJ family two-component response regulator